MFPKGLCVDCGMSVPDGDIICDVCKAAWQTYSSSVSRDMGQRGDATVQPGQQELHDKDGVQLLSTETTNDAQVRDGQERPGC